MKSRRADPFSFAVARAIEVTLLVPWFDFRDALLPCWALPGCSRSRGVSDRVLDRVAHDGEPPRLRDTVDRGATLAVLALGMALLGAWPLSAAEPVALRFESFCVTPAHLPSAVVVVANHGQGPYQGVLQVKAPEGWLLSPDRQEVALGPGETRRVAFAVKRGLTREENSYLLEASITGGGTTVTRAQQVAAASAPYFKPEIDGKIDDWGDAIPVTWISGGKKTVVSTYWNRRQFSLLVAVEEDRLLPRGAAPATGCDAVQVAISPEGAATGRSADDEATRFEFLFVATGEGTGGKCFLLAEPGMKLGEGQKLRPLGPLAYDDAQVAVSRSGGMSYYECAIPFKLLGNRIRPSEGREFRLSVLVHDPDGTGIRDWGEAAGLDSSQRNRLAWSLWPGAQWGDQPPLDNKTTWGLCSSKY